MLSTWLSPFNVMVLCANPVVEYLQSLQRACMIHLGSLPNKVVMVWPHHQTMNLERLERPRKQSKTTRVARVGRGQNLCRACKQFENKEVASTQEHKNNCPNMRAFKTFSEAKKSSKQHGGTACHNIWGDTSLPANVQGATRNDGASMQQTPTTRGVAEHSPNQRGQQTLEQANPAFQPVVDKLSSIHPRNTQWLWTRLPRNNG